MERDGGSLSWTLRSGRPEDAAAIVGFWKIAGTEPTTTDDPDSIRSLLTHDPGALVVAEVGGEVVGTLMAAWDGWRGNLYRLAVHPGHRRRGLGRALAEEAWRRLSARESRRVNALVVRGDERAVAFWEAVGFPVDDHVQRHVRTV